MAKKTKITAPKIKKSSRKSYKSIIFALIFGLVMLGGYATYKNLVKPASINVADGLEAEEAAYIQKKTVKSNQAPAPVVKVTVENADGTSRTSAVILNKTEKTNEKGEKISIEDQIKSEVVAKGIITDSKGAVVGGGSLNQPSASTDPLVTTPGAVGGTCSVNGANLPSNKYVPTGFGISTDTNGKTSRCTAAGCTQRECVLLKSDCSHGEVVACDVAYTRDPTSVVFPTNAGKEYTGNGPTFKNNCFDKSGTTHLSGSVSSGDRCYDGKWVSEEDFDEKMALNCKSGQTYDKDKNTCQDGPTIEQTADAAKNSHIKICKASGFEGWNASTNSCEGVSGVHIKYRTNYTTKDKCEIAAGNDTCIPVQGGGYAIVPKNSSIKSVTYNTGTMAGRPTSLTGNSYKDLKVCELAVRGGEKCEPITGSSSTTAGSGGYRIVADTSNSALEARKPFLQYEFGKASAGNAGAGSSTPGSTPPDLSEYRQFKNGTDCGAARSSDTICIENPGDTNSYSLVPLDDPNVTCRGLSCGWTDAFENGGDSAQDDSQYRQFQDKTKCAQAIGSSEARCLENPNNPGTFSLVPIDDPNADCGFWSCDWSDSYKTRMANANQGGINTPAVAQNVGDSCGAGNATWGCNDKCGGVFTTIEVSQNNGIKKFKSNYCGTAEDVAALNLDDPYVVVKENVQTVNPNNTASGYPGLPGTVPMTTAEASSAVTWGVSSALICAGALAFAPFTTGLSLYGLGACATAATGIGWLAATLTPSETQAQVASPTDSSTTPTTNYIVVKDYTLEQTLKPGDRCNTKASCQTKCEDAIVTTYTVNGNTKQYMCGDETFVAATLKEQKTIDYTVVGDNTGEHTLKAGQVCGNWLSAKECRDKCAGGYTSVDTSTDWDYGGFRYVCGGADVLADPTSPATVAPSSSQDSTEPELTLTAKEREEKVHIENLQIKMKKVMEVDPNAFAFKDHLSRSTCEPGCVPIPGLNSYLSEQDIIDATKRLNIGLND